MTSAEEVLLIVRRHPGDYRTAKYRLSDIGGLRWDKLSGGVQRTAFGQYYLYGYVACNEAVEGNVAHSGVHGPCPHTIKVCILRQDNISSYELLVRDLPPKPEYARSQPKTGNICKVDIIETLSSKGAMRETELTKVLVEIGHGANNIKFVLKKLAKQKVIICGKDPDDKRFNVYRVSIE